MNITLTNPNIYGFRSAGLNVCIGLSLSDTPGYPADIDRHPLTVEIASAVPDVRLYGQIGSSKKANDNDIEICNMS